MPPLKLIARALWESFKRRTPAQRLERARARLLQADALERAALAEIQRMKAHALWRGPEQLRKLKRARRRLERIQRRTDRLSGVVSALDEVVN